MKVSEMLQGFIDKTITKKTLTELSGLNPRTVQRKLSNAGFKWISPQQGYEYNGDVDVDVLELLASTPSKKNQSNNDKPVKKKAPAKTTTAQTKASSSDSNSVDTSSETEAITSIVNGKASNKSRPYRGFYFDEDVLAVIDSVSSGNKSELINQALRKAFKETGLL